jgi:hypothetical protein
MSILEFLRISPFKIYKKNVAHFIPIKHCVSWWQKHWCGFMKSWVETWKITYTKFVYGEAYYTYTVLVLNKM